jgi:mannose-1-phosphate guanylyltransferase
MQNKIKQAVILSAGLGTRLRPLTDNLPKPMLPLGGKPMLEWNIEQFKKHGVTEFFLNLHYLPHVIKSYLGDGSKLGVKVSYNEEKELLGSAGGVKSFENQLDDTFFLIYGDILSFVDYSKMAKEFFKRPDAIGMQRMIKTDDYTDADVAELNSDQSYKAVHPKPHSKKYDNAYRMRGIFILKKEILSFIPKETFYEIGKQLLPDVVGKGKKFYAYECAEFSKGIDTADKYKEVKEYIEKNR